MKYLILCLCMGACATSPYREVGPKLKMENLLKNDIEALKTPEEKLNYVLMKIAEHEDEIFKLHMLNIVHGEE